MNEDRTFFQSDIYSLVDYEVLDRNNKKIGKVEAVWEDASGQPAFLAIRSGWLGMGRSHFVPAHSVEASEKSRAIRLPYDEETVKNAPDFDAQADIDESSEARIFDYYRGKGLAVSEGYDRDWSTAPETAKTGEETIPLKEEQVRVNKTSEDAGGVRIRKVVRTETASTPVELQREDVVIERVPAGSERSADASFGEDEIFIPLRRERAEVNKTTHVAEEVRARKTTQSEHETISETVRKEDIEVEREK